MKLNSGLQMEPKRTSRARVWQKEWDRTPWDNTRRTVFTETTDATHLSQSVRVQNKRNAKMQKYQDYQVFYYGSEGEKAVRKSHLRQQLKEQVDQIENPHQVFAQSVAESQKLAEEDRQRRLQEAQSNNTKKEFLSKFRDDNKMLIEVHAANRRAERQAERNADKQLLEHNPINWSNSLW